MLLDDVQLQNGDGPALEIASENPIEAAGGEPLPPFEVKVRGGSIASQVHNPIIMTGPARLDIRDTRISSGNRDNYCISLSDKDSYTSSGLTMQCAGSPRGMTGSEQADPQ